MALALCASFAASAPSPPAGLHDPLLDDLAGRWNLEREIRGGHERNAVDAQWVLGHQFLQLHMVDVARPPRYEALMTIGFDPDAGRYVAHWCDTWGGRFSAIGQGKRDGNSIEFEFAFRDGPFFNTFTWDPASRQWTCLLENVGKDGKRAFFARDFLRRP
jgi:hypothetical protein